MKKGDILAQHLAQGGYFQREIANFVHLAYARVSGVLCCHSSQLTPDIESPRKNADLSLATLLALQFRRALYEQVNSLGALLK